MIDTGMDNDAGGVDDIGGSVSDAVTMAMARRVELESDTHGPGSTIGDLVTMPPASDLDSILSGVPPMAPEGQ